MLTAETRTLSTKTSAQLNALLALRSPGRIGHRGAGSRQRFARISDSYKGWQWSGGHILGGILVSSALRRCILGFPLDFSSK